MKNLVSTAKMLLIERATELYTDRRSDLETSEYADYYKQLGKLVARIDEYIYLSTIINDMEQGDFHHIGLCNGDEDILEFMKELYESV
jgi:hypothetical protein